MTKTCTKCGEGKLLTFFSADRASKDGKSCRCKDCDRIRSRERACRRRADPDLAEADRRYRREYHAKNRDERNAYAREHLRHLRATDPAFKERQRANQRLVKFGLREAAYYRLLEDQGFCCASCGDELELRLGQGRGKSGAHVDHCHDTGRVRAVLCGQCNTAFGHLQDDVVRVERLAVYARKHSQGLIHCEHDVG